MDNNFELIPFDSFEELAQHNTPEDCYVASELIVFDLSNKIEDSELLSVEDCGTDVTGKVALSELEDEYIQDFMGYMTEIVRPQTEAELRRKIEGEEEETLEREETDSFFSWSLEDGALIASLLILLAILISFWFVSSRRRKSQKTQEVQTENIKENREKDSEEKGTV